MRVEQLETDILVIGGGTAGCYAALTAAEASLEARVLVAEKANIRRSGCLAAGVNAINAYITKGETPESYTEFVRWDAAGIIRDDLVLSMARRFNEAARRLEALGLVILKDENGEYAARGRQNIKINGENIKVILADAVQAQKNVTVLNHINITDYLLSEDGRVVGAAGFDVNEPTAYFIRSRAVICAAGGVAGLYRPNNPGFSRHKMWYPPFNTGAGYALGIRAGAEMTSFEMRFVAQRCRDTIAPTGTIALGVGAREINALEEVIDGKYGLTTSGRAFAVASETHEGRGPCYLRTEGITPQQDQELLRAYLNMAPSQTLKWLESGKMPSEQNVEIEGTEPYVVGGHTGSGYWVDTARRTTLPGLYAAGDVAGGAPKKFVTGALAEGEIAAETALADLAQLPLTPAKAGQEGAILAAYETALAPDGDRIYDADQLEEAMQKVMDSYAGGIGSNYRYSVGRLRLGQEKLNALENLAAGLTAADTDELMRVYELRDRLMVCRVLIAHMLARQETRWPGFGVNTDFPAPDDDWSDLVVNSVIEDGSLRVFTRKLERGGTAYEHTDPA